MHGILLNYILVKKNKMENKVDALNEITSRVLYELIEKKVSPILDEIYTDEKIKQII